MGGLEMEVARDGWGAKIGDASRGVVRELV